MVSYGDESFREWADECGFNDADVALIKKTVNKRKWIWILVYLVIIGASYLGTYIGGEAGTALTSISGIGVLVIWFCLPLMVECFSFSRILKYGSFTNAKPGLFISLFSIVMFITFLSIIPIFIWHFAKKRLWGTGINKLIKKGLIGNH